MKQNNVWYRKSKFLKIGQIVHRRIQKNSNTSQSINGTSGKGILEMKLTYVFCHAQKYVFNSIWFRYHS